MSAARLNLCREAEAGRGAGRELAPQRLQEPVPYSTPQGLMPPSRPTDFTAELPSCMPAPLLIAQMFTEHLLYARSCSEHKRHSSKKLKPCPQKADILVVRDEKKEVNT